MTTETSGPQITTSLDGREVASFDTGSLPSGASVYGTGSVGFATLGSEAAFRDLDVTTPGGAASTPTVWTTPLHCAFAGPNTAYPIPSR